MKHKIVWLSVACMLALSGCGSLPSWLGGHPKEKEKLAGDRIAVLPLSTALQPDETLKDSVVSLPPVTANPDWPQHTGAVSPESANLAGSSFTHVEQEHAGEGNAFDHILIPRPVVADGMVFAMDAIGNISAHDAGNIGTVRWHSAGVAEKDEPEVMGGGLAWDQGKLYATSGRGVVVALDGQTGKEIWRKSLRIPFRSAPKVADNKLFATTIDNQVYALSTVNGDVLWSQRGMSESAGIMNSISPAIAGNTLIVPFSSGEIYALGAEDGHELWNDALSSTGHTQASAAFSGIGGDPVVDGSVVFAVSSGGMTSVLSLTNGQHAWDKPVGGFNTPWVAGDYMFLLTADNTLVAFVKFTGKIRWATKLPGFANMAEKKDPITWKGPVLVDGQLAVVGSNGQLLLVSAAGGVITSTLSIPEGIYTAPIVAGGRMYLMGQDATLYALH